MRRHPRPAQTVDEAAEKVAAQLRELAALNEAAKVLIADLSESLDNKKRKP